MLSHSVMISLLTNMKSITTLFSDDVSKLAQLSEVETVNNIKIIKDQVDRLVESKKQQFFKDGSLLEEYFKSTSKDRNMRLKQSLENDFKGFKKSK